MAKNDTTLIAMGGGELAEAVEVLAKFTELLKRNKDPQLAVMTIATSEPEKARDKYEPLFKENGIRNVSFVDVSQRDDAFEQEALDRIDKADALYFTGGDQLNITSLLGGSRLHKLIAQKIRRGFLIAGTNAGAAMMSTSMTTDGRRDHAPAVDAVEIAQGMNLIPETIIDTHFSTKRPPWPVAYGHSPLSSEPRNRNDERTAIVVHEGEFMVVGEGCVTVIDAGNMKYSDLPYKNQGDKIAMFDGCLHVLPRGYKFELENREPKAPVLKNLVGHRDAG